VRANARPKPIIGSADRRNAIWVRIRRKRGAQKRGAPCYYVIEIAAGRERIETPPHGLICHARGVPIAYYEAEPRGQSAALLRK
jgi:hypothetical protein